MMPDVERCPSVEGRFRCELKREHLGDHRQDVPDDVGIGGVQANWASASPDTDLHACELRAPHDSYGVAVDDVREHEDGTLWAANGEYASQVNYCPVCGYRAKIAVTPTSD